MASGIASAQAHISSITGYHIQDKDLVRQALDITGYGTPQANRRLALVGDTVLQAAIVDDWFATGQPTGTADNVRSTVASNSNLARAGRRASLDDHIIVQPGQYGMPVGDKALATTVEAVFGAIYLDSGKNLNAVKTAMTALNLAHLGQT